MSHIVLWRLSQGKCETKNVSDLPHDICPMSARLDILPLLFVNISLLAHKQLWCTMHSMLQVCLFVVVFFYLKCTEWLLLHCLWRCFGEMAPPVHTPTNADHLTVQHAVPDSPVKLLASRLCWAIINARLGTVASVSSSTFCHPRFYSSARLKWKCTSRPSSGGCKQRVDVFVKVPANQQDGFAAAWHDACDFLVFSFGDRRIRASLPWAGVHTKLSPQLCWFVLTRNVKFT